MKEGGMPEREADEDARNGKQDKEGTRRGKKRGYKAWNKEGHGRKVEETDMEERGAGYQE